MNLHRGQRPERRRQFLAGHRLRFRHGFPCEHFRRDARHRDRRLAPESLERRTIDYLAAVLFFEFHPHSQHVAAIRAADRADRIRVFHFAEVTRVFHRLLDLRLQIVVHVCSTWYRGSFGSISALQASIPPRKLLTFSKPCPWKYAAASMLRAPA